MNSNILALSTAAATGLANLFVYNYFGEMANNSFRRMPDDLYEFDWKDLPIQLQKYIILMLGNMQQPLYYHGFGVANLNLETFGKVRNFV